MKYLLEQLQYEVSERILNNPLLRDKWDPKGLYANTNIPLDMIHAPIHVKNLCIRLRNDPPKLYWITKKQYIQFLTLDKLDMFTISKCHLVNIEIVKSHPHLEWHLPALSRNPSISHQDMLANPEYKWCKCWMTRNPTVSQEYILNNLDDFDKSETEEHIWNDSDSMSEDNSDDNYREYTMNLPDEYDSILSGFSVCDEDQWNYIYLTKILDIDFILNNPKIPWCVYSLYRRPDFTYTRERYELLEKMRAANVEEFPSYITSKHFHTWELVLDHPEIKWDWYEVLKNYANVCWDTCIHNIVRDYGEIDYRELSETHTPIPVGFWINSIAKNAKWNFRALSLYSKGITFAHVLATKHKPKVFRQWEWKFISQQYISLENLVKHPDLPWNIKDLTYKNHTIDEWLVIKDKVPALRDRITQLLEERGYYTNTLTLDEIKKHINTVNFNWYYISRNRDLFAPTIEDKVEFFRRVHYKRVILRAWRNAYLNPKYFICKKRLNREVRELNTITLDNKNNKN